MQYTLAIMMENTIGCCIFFYDIIKPYTDNKVSVVFCFYISLFDLREEHYTNAYMTRFTFVRLYVVMQFIYIFTHTVMQLYLVMWLCNLYTSVHIVIHPTFHLIINYCEMSVVIKLFNYCNFFIINMFSFLDKLT